MKPTRYGLWYTVKVARSESDYFIARVLLNADAKRRSFS